MTSGSRAWFRNAQGSVRAGWVISCFALAAALGLFGAQAVLLLARVPEWAPAWIRLSLLMSSVSVFSGALVATVVCRLLFREPTGLEGPSPWRKLAIGKAIGGLLMSLAVAIPLLFGHGSLHVSASASWHFWARLSFNAMLLALASLAEELLVRGLVFQTLRRGVGDFMAVLLTGGLFGLGHWFNPNSTLLAVANVALVGFVFGALAIRFDSLWVPIGVHVAWNLCEGLVYGQPVSGLRLPPALLEGDLDIDKVLWSGGRFGPEQSAVVSVLLLFTLVLTLAWGQARPAGQAQRLEVRG
jgi:uncharacterized protein